MEYGADFVTIVAMADARVRGSMKQYLAKEDSPKDMEDLKEESGDAGQ